MQETDKGLGLKVEALLNLVMGEDEGLVMAVAVYVKLEEEENAIGFLLLLITG